MKIQVGCGDSPIPGWRNFDNSISLRLARVPFLARVLQRAGLLDARQYAFIRYTRNHHVNFGNAVKGLPLPDSCADALYSCHMLEHLSRSEAGKFLEEAKRVLIPGGIIRLAVPDLRRQAVRYLASGDADEFIDGTYLGEKEESSPARRLTWLLTGRRLHRWMYDEISLGRLLRKHGFSDIAAPPPGETRIKDPGELDLKEKSEESVYLEAAKPGQ